jgi:ATPase family associated with various cellular activities (AAA)
MPALDSQWFEANQTDLLARLAAVKRKLAQRVSEEAASAITTPELSDAQRVALDERPSAFARLAATFELSGFEQESLLLCAGVEIDSSVPSLCAAVQGDPERAYPTFGMALATLTEPHWWALSPDAALRRWRLVELGNGHVLTRALLKIDERVLHYLLGVDDLDERLAVLLDPLPPIAIDQLVPSQAAIAAQVAEVWSHANRSRELTVVQLCGGVADCRPIVAAAAGRLGLRAASLPAERLPTAPADLDNLLRLWEREAPLSGLGVLMVDEDDFAHESEAARNRAAGLALLLERAAGPLILRQREPRRIAGRPSTMFEVGRPTHGEQFEAWRENLGGGEPEPEVRAAAEQFSLSLPAIRAIAAEAQARAAASPPERIGPVVWDLCRRRLRNALDGLARRIDSELTWNDLVLPPPQKEILRAIAAQLRQRNLVYEVWGFAAKSQRGLGISALFYGPSGVGKTMAAEVLAAELKLDLYHIDLSQVVSKYIGETEANLRRVFDAAEENGAILLFDEADSLFGVRSQVKDSHDRYANIEVSYLLQRMESYRGLAILTTNMRQGIDQAFLRRIRFSVEFPFPDATRRAEIWRGVFPAATRTEGLDFERLGRLRLAGGSIRNIALNAAFLAAESGEPVRMRHLRQAAQVEYTKLERRPAPTESEAWAVDARPDAGASPPLKANAWA